MDEEQLRKLLERGNKGYCQVKGGKRTSIPEDIMDYVINRDNVCVYCKHPFGSTRCNMATWEHINNDTRDVEEWNIALCCGSCNFSRSDYKLKDWFKETPRGKTINQEKLADVIVEYIDKYEKE